MADDMSDQDGHGPGERPGCDATRLWHDMDPVFDKHASETGRGQGELAHLAICRYVDGLLEGGADQQAEHLVAELALLVMAHRGDQAEAQEEATTSTKH
jgi:hypothetical protein